MTKDTSNSANIEQEIIAVLKTIVRRGKTLEEAREEMRKVLHEAERQGTEKVIEELGFKEAVECPPRVPCRCGKSLLALSGRRRKRELDLSIGTISFHRPYYAPGGDCGCPGRHPLDDKLGIARGPLSEDVAKSLTPSGRDSTL